MPSQINVFIVLQAASGVKVTENSSSLRSAKPISIPLSSNSAIITFGDSIVSGIERETVTSPVSSLKL